MLLATAPALYAPLAPGTVRHVGAIMDSNRFHRWGLRTQRNRQRFIVFAFDVDLAFLNGLIQRSQEAPRPAP